jgi:hypothetical protein
MSSFTTPRDPYLNEYFTEHEYGDFTPFYITICICLVIVAALLLLNLVLCCCSQHADYWTNNNTGINSFLLNNFVLMK